MIVAALLVAATLGEVPPLPARGQRFCTDVTATPGEVVVSTLTGVRIVSATRSGFRSGPSIRFGEAFLCGQVATRPSGAGVAAGTVGGAVVVSVRDPGGGWGAPMTLAPGSTEARP